MKNLILESTTNVTVHQESGPVSGKYILELISESSNFSNSEKTSIQFGYHLIHKNNKEIKEEDAVYENALYQNTNKTVTVDLNGIQISTESFMTKDIKTYEQFFEKFIKNLFLEFCNSKNFYGLQWVIKE